MEPVVVNVVKILICVASLIVAFAPNVLYAAFSLLVAFFGVAIMYVLGGADFLAGAQVIIYVGGILVVILFAIMLSHRIYHLSIVAQVTRAAVAGAVGVGLIGILIHVNKHFPWADFTKSTLPERTSVVTTMGNALLKEYVLPFEAVSVLLLVALIGGMVISRPIERDQRDPGGRENG